MLNATANRERQASRASDTAASAGFSSRARAAGRQLAGAPLGLLAIVVAWQALTTFGVLDPRIIPGPGDVVHAFESWVGGSGEGPYDGTWIESALLTAQRVFAGYALAALLGVLLGVLLGYFRPLYAVGDPIVQVFRPIPAVAWVPLAVVIFGFNSAATVFLIAYGAFFPIVINTTNGVRRSQRKFLLVGRMLGMNRGQMLRFVVLPAALPSIFVGLRLGAGLAWVLAIVGEMIAVRSGLGYALMNAYSVFRYDVIVAAMISFAALGYLTDRLLLVIEDYVLKWRKGFDVAT